MTSKLMNEDSDLSNPKNKVVLKWFSKALLAISVFLLMLLISAYIFQPDFCTAVTFWPVWLWAIPGIVLSLAGINTYKKTSLAISFLWVLFVVFMAEEPLGLLRSCTRFNRDCKSACASGICLRVVSFNCAGGNIAAAEEILQYVPDIILLQESPSAKDLEILTKKLFTDGGEFVLEGDMAILARGQIIKKDKWAFTRVGASIRLHSGIEIEAMSVHFPPPSTSINLLSPNCWREHFEDRRMRLQQITAIIGHLEPLPENVPIIAGGDFNAKPWRGAIKVLSQRLNDSFGQAGCGWPGTGPSHIPLWRVDQIWTSRHFKTIKVYSVASKNSDHRIVICDLCKL